LPYENGQLFTRQGKQKNEGARDPSRKVAKLKAIKLGLQDVGNGLIGIASNGYWRAFIMQSRFKMTKLRDRKEQVHNFWHLGAQFAAEGGRG